MGATRLFFLLFCVFLASVSSVKELKDINDLRNSGYANIRPRHGLLLLFWFAQHILFIQNDNNHLQLDFDPRINNAFHSFRNIERILPPLSNNQIYYSVGNLNDRYASALPEYVRRFYRNSNLPERNMDRLIISSDTDRPDRISNVFITAHNRNYNDFNCSETYEIFRELILMIRETNCLNVHTGDVYRCNQFLKQIGYNSNNFWPKDSLQNERLPYSQSNTYDEIKLKIKTTTQGYAKLIWKNIPANIMNIYIDICRNTPSSDPNKDPKQVVETSFKVHESSGALDTSVLLNAGLQPRLKLYNKNYYYYSDIWNGPEFDGANRVIPIRIKGIDAYLQLYAGDGKACARLYIKKTFSNWYDVLYYSWVGFYKSSQDKNDGYSTYKYAVRFAKIEDDSTNDYDIYYYKSGSVIAPGVQIRFFLDKTYNKVLARTTPWEYNKNVASTCDKGNPKLSSPWHDPEFFNEPELYDANNVLPIQIKTYDAGLQLFTKDGKACARLYIKKTFTDWKKTFFYSWVGFYIGSQKTNKQYNTYQYAVNFEKMEEGTEQFDVYHYKSKLAIEPGVEIRFMKDKGYDNNLAVTESWTSA